MPLSFRVEWLLVGGGWLLSLMVFVFFAAVGCMPGPNMRLMLDTGPGLHVLIVPAFAVLLIGWPALLVVQRRPPPPQTVHGEFRWQPALFQIGWLGVGGVLALSLFFGWTTDLHTYSLLNRPITDWEEVRRTASCEDLSAWPSDLEVFREEATAVCNAQAQNNRLLVGGAVLSFLFFGGLAWRGRHRSTTLRELVFDGQGVRLRGRRSRRIAWSTLREVRVQHWGFGPFREQDLVFELVDGDEVIVPADASPWQHLVTVTNVANACLERPDRETEVMAEPAELASVLARSRR